MSRTPDGFGPGNGEGFRSASLWRRLACGEEEAESIHRRISAEPGRRRILEEAEEPQAEL